MTKIVTFSPENPNGIERDMTAEEQAQFDTDLANAETKRQADRDAKAQKANDQASGNQKLLDLGLTQAEVTALTGYRPPVED